MVCFRNRRSLRPSCIQGLELPQGLDASSLVVSDFLPENNHGKPPPTFGAGILAGVVSGENVDAP
jgi:hypothetical protein